MNVPPAHADEPTHPSIFSSGACYACGLGTAELDRESLAWQSGVFRGNSSELKRAERGRVSAK